MNGSRFRFLPERLPARRSTHAANVRARLLIGGQRDYLALPNLCRLMKPDRIAHERSLVSKKLLMHTAEQQ